MLGDNSPCSKDSRGWASSDTWDTTDRKFWEVPRSLLTGKAFLYLLATRRAFRAGHPLEPRHQAALPPLRRTDEVDPLRILPGLTVESVMIPGRS